MTASDNRPGTGRRRFLTRAAAMTLSIGVTGGLLGALPAQAAPQDGLPAIGTEISMSGLAMNTSVQIRTALVSLDFRGGLKVRVIKNPQDPENSVRLKVIGFRMSAELPDTGDRASRQGGGTVTLEQNDVDANPKSLLKLTQKSPPLYEQTLVLDFTMTIDQPDDRNARRPEPLVLTSKSPMVLVGTNLIQFPPKGKIHKLKNPVDLILPEDPDTTLATIEKFPVKLSKP
nr:hypothetical protein [Kibdelosporangium sp. MJ126-NF4]CEL22866.1 hypothetical protein [Kibdelosporangium sp. MJ126-NF4]CTQ90006.1 hypothetical protein [Kibdelosporangium sp. MJ126-NF4]